MLKASSQELINLADVLENGVMLR